MAHFYGTLDSNGGESTRCGSKKSGMKTYCASHAGAVRSTAYVNREEVDCVRVVKIHREGQGECKLLYDGPIGEVKKEQAETFGSRKASN
jgi:hypothetical protein